MGGAVREIVRSTPEKIKDWDFSMEVPNFSAMRNWLNDNKFEIFVETPDYLTMRARSPKGFEFAGMKMEGLTFDFAMCRSEGDYHDSRHPDSVEPGTIQIDLSRRDFTMNAMAMNDNGDIIDPYDGERDISKKIIRCVRDVNDRFNEDALRIMRALRFMVQLDFLPQKDIDIFLSSEYGVDLLDKIDQNRIRDELTKAFTISTLDTLFWLERFPLLRNKLFETNLWLLPTVKGRK